MKKFIVVACFSSNVLAAHINLQPGEETSIIDSSYRRVLITCSGQAQNNGEDCRLNKCSGGNIDTYTIGFTDKGYWRELTSCQPLEKANQNLEIFRQSGQCRY